ncbi:helix-turn-helix domain-containing protein [Curtobacterium luteum]|uniref:AraC family transcriptional regulator n=1 Tax=Curtobacterium luteum TaxID=33881 RepID=UPI00381242C1
MSDTTLPRPVRDAATRRPPGVEPTPRGPGARATAGAAADAVAARSAVRLEAAGRTPHSVVDEVGGLYDGHGWSARPTDQPFTYRYTAIGDTDITLRRSRITGWIRGGIAPSDEYIVQWLTAGHGVPDVVRDRVPLAVGQLMLFPTNRDHVFEYEDYDQRLVHLSRSLVHDVAAERLHVVPVDDLRPDHLRALDPATVQRFQQQMALLSRELHHGVGTLLWQSLSRDAAAAFLALYPPRVPTMPRELLLPRRIRLRAAVEYLHDHVAEPVRVSEVAAAAGLSIRSVQEGFQRVLGESPLQYLQRIRLECVRSDLLVADPETCTVRDVARRWGFAHLGRFAAVYAAQFGEYPRETIRR